MSDVKPEDIRQYIISLISKYEKQVEDVVKDNTRQLSDKIKPELKGYSRKGEQLYKTGVYKRGWSKRVINKKDAYQIKIYNRSKPTIVHLLEFGHVIAGTGRMSKAFPHVQKTELKYLQILLEELEKGVNK